jgi:hypothetical protein
MRFENNTFSNMGHPARHLAEAPRVKYTKIRSFIFMGAKAAVNLFGPTRGGIASYRDEYPS